MGISLIVHGGAKEIPPEKQEAHREGCRRAAEAGWAVLERGGSAVDAVEASIRVLEADPTFNAGYGSELNEDGEVQMDAAIMEGKEMRAGGVAAIQAVRHPISVARRMLEEEEVLIVADGARHFAEAKGVELCDRDDLITEERRREWVAKEFPPGRANNTVGAAARDAQGVVAAGASTGGLGGDRRGRVGDTPQIGAGVYADNDCGATAMTGDGEKIARVALAKTVADLLCGPYYPDEVARKAMIRLRTRVGGEGGCVLVDKDGRVGWGHNSPHMAVAYRVLGMERAKAFVQKAEEVRSGVSYLG